VLTCTFSLAIPKFQVGEDKLAGKKKIKIKDSEDSSVIIEDIPILPRRDLLAFPRLISQIVVFRPIFQRTLEEAIANERRVVIVGRGNVGSPDFEADDLYKVGTMATVGRIVKTPEGAATVWVQGDERVRILEITQTAPFYKGKVEIIAETSDDSTEEKASMRSILDLFEKCVQLSNNLSWDVYLVALNSEKPGELADLIASSLSLEMEQRQEILETVEPVKRLATVNLLLAHEVEVLEIQGRIEDEVRDSLDKSHREYFLREQMKAIQQELTGVDPQQQEMDVVKGKIEESGMSKVAKKKAYEEAERLSQISSVSPEHSVVRTYLDWLINVPWKNGTKDNLDIRKASQILEDNHYGLPKVKERILEYLAVRKLSKGRLRSPILCLVGAPGVGKTSLGKSIALAMGRKFVRISLGGIRDEAEIRGHRRTYVGALPGRIIQTMKQAGTKNPLFMLDEIDKIGSDFRGDPSSALLEALDPEQNASFSDHYLEVPYDLSQVMFVCTANVLDPIIPALHDRMEMIELPGYTEEEKLQIARKFLFPRQLEEHGLTDDDLRFSDNGILRIVREYTREAGVRNLEREIGAICRKVARRVADGQNGRVLVTPQSLARYLGPPKFTWGVAEQKDEVGVATGVAYTPAGGDILSIEVALMKGKGNLMLTGQLGEVMKESAQAALSYSRARSRDLQLKEGYFSSKDIHIHVPAGAMPKEGPSAGVALTTALVSAVTNQPVRRDIAMTGEITLRGKILGVGGIKEKVLAAHRAGITSFILPIENRKDISEIPRKVRRDINFIFVKDMEEVLELALRRS
jgi:ATP-dependent Lon protease